MDSYDPKSCSALEKPYYKPIEAALRWCGLIKHEEEILLKTGDDLVPSPSAFPRWPCLRVNAEKIHGAVVSGELVSCRDGRPVRLGEQVKKERLSIRHTDLKIWMSKHYPDQKPAFLFDEVERSTHSSISAEAFRALQVENLALQLRVEKAIETYLPLKQERDALARERDELLERDSVLGEKAEWTYLNIIGAMQGLMLGKSSAGVRNSVFIDQSSIIDAVVANYGERWGISRSNLERKFAAVNRNFRKV